jgi:hypothetical protein
LFALYVNGIPVPEVGSQLVFDYPMSTFEAELSASVYDPNRLIKFDLARRRAILPIELRRAIEKTFWSAGIGHFLSERFGFLDAPLPVSRGWGPTSGHICSAVIFDTGTYWPLNMIGEFGGIITEINLRVAPGRYRSNFTGAYHMYGKTRDRLRNAIAPGELGRVVVSLNARPLGQFERDKVSLLGCDVDGYVAVYRCEASLSWQSGEEAKRVNVVRLFPRTHGVSMDEMSELCGIEANSPEVSSKGVVRVTGSECFRKGRIEVSEKQRAALKRLMELDEVSGITLYSVRPVGGADSYLMPGVWREIIGERGLPYGADDFDSLMRALPLGWQGNFLHRERPWRGELLEKFDDDDEGAEGRDFWKESDEVDQN